ncbi:MAG TPA: Cof-type HAD-IIB family hydrolase [Candidatus Scybalocola faecipullorum]|nr:Cof-type HAD-IIB family hydrolase [Candidatus Scybalocola faecipullorum]
MMDKKLIIFDMDGTLNKTETCAAPAILDALADMGITSVTKAQVLDTFGAKDEDTNVRFFGADAEKMGSVFWKKVSIYMKDRYSECHEAYYGAAKLLKWLKLHGYTVVVCSNNSSMEHICGTLKKIGLYEWIDRVYPVPVGKTKDEILNVLLEREQPEWAVMVGDRFYDKEAAKNNGISFAGCLYGYGKAEELKDADILLEQITDLIFYLWKKDMTACRLLAFDLDGTLTNSKKELTKETRNLLMKVQQQGIRIVLASGRPVYGVMPLAEELELSKYGGYILAFNGACLFDCFAGETIFSENICAEMALELAGTSKEYSAALLTYEDDHLVTENSKDCYVIKEASINHMDIKEVENFENYVNFPMEKCIIAGDKYILEKAEKELQKRFENILSVYRSEPYFLEIMAPGIHKAKALAQLLERLHLPKDSLIAFGDGYNDQSMLEFAGLGVAMENAADPVKAAADTVTKNNDSNGVVYALCRLLPTEVVG